MRKEYVLLFLGVTSFLCSMEKPPERKNPPTLVNIDRGILRVSKKDFVTLEIAKTIATDRDIKKLKKAVVIVSFPSCKDKKQRKKKRLKQKKKFSQAGYYVLFDKNGYMSAIYPWPDSIPKKCKQPQKKMVPKNNLFY